MKSDSMDGDASDHLEHQVGETQKKRARTVEEALVAGGWELKRAKKHIQFSRRVRLPDGQASKQNITLPKTPSDWRAEKNTLAELRRLDENVTVEEEDEELMKCSVCKQMKKCITDYSKAQRRKGANMKCKECVALM